MPLPSSIVGASGEPLTQLVDARWTMAYAAGLGHADAAFLDTDARTDVLAHPLFPVCFEWPLLIGARHLPAMEALSLSERVRGVHATHHLELHAPLRADTTVTTLARVVAVEARPPGAYQLTRLHSVDEAGSPICTTWYGTLYRGVGVEGEDRRETGALPPSRGPLPMGDAALELELPIAGGAAHVYSECSRIWNPIHTDIGVARRAGLPDLILHGTATLALAVSQVVKACAGGDMERVDSIEARFGAMVRMPSRCGVRVTPGPPHAFEVWTDTGERAIRDGVVGVR